MSDFEDGDPSLVFDPTGSVMVPLERSCLAALAHLVRGTVADPDPDDSLRLGVHIHIVLSTTWRLDGAMRAFLYVRLHVSAVRASHW